MEQLVVPSSLAASSSPHLPCHRRHAAPSPCRRLQAVGGFGCARPESTGVAVNFRTPQFKLLEPLTEKLWTLNDFEGNPALQVSHSFCIACAKCIYLQLVTEETPLCIIYSTGC